MQFTENVYSLPLSSEANISMIVSDGPGHPGPYKGAVDLAVKPGSDVLSPLEGEVIKVVDAYDQYGNDPKYAEFANYIQIAHDNGETSTLMHLAAGSALVKVGEKVRLGQKVAKTGLSGYMTEPHLHWAVWVRDDSKHGFHGLYIRGPSTVSFYK